MLSRLKAPSCTGTKSPWNEKSGMP